MKNYSRQREAILEVLRSTDCHPAASWVYEKVKEKIPNISLGTVYRNLSELSNSGEILSIFVKDGFEHFDGNNKPHVHLHCKICGRIIDAELGKDIIKEIAEQNGFEVQSSLYIVYGICNKCKQKINGGN